MSVFDSLQSAMFDTVTNTMGYNATWSPAAGGQSQTKQVLYNGPTEKEKLFDANYDPEKLNMEYKEGVFPGLKESVDGGNAETVTIENIGTFRVRGVQKLFDGKNYKATLIKVN